MNRWHCLISRPQAERKAEDWLRLYCSAYAFHPVQRAIRVVNGTKHEFDKRLLPGYVFSRFPSEVKWYNLFTGCPYIVGAIRLADGTPATLDPRDLEAIWKLRARSEEMEAERQRRGHLRISDKVRILTGLLPPDQQKCEVIGFKIEGQRKTVKIRLFGTGTEMLVDEGSLAKEA